MSASEPTTEAGKRLVENSYWNDGMRAVVTRFPGPVNNEGMMRDFVRFIEREAREQERLIEAPIVRAAIAWTAATEIEELTGDGSLQKAVDAARALREAVHRVWIGSPLTVEYQVVWRRKGRPARRKKYITKRHRDILIKALRQPHDEHRYCDHETGYCSPLTPIESIVVEQRYVGEWEDSHD